MARSQAGRRRSLDRVPPSDGPDSTAAHDHDEFQKLFDEDDRLAQESAACWRISPGAGPRSVPPAALFPVAVGGPDLQSAHLRPDGPAHALQCRPTDAQAILGEGNEAANKLERPGDAVYNDDPG